MGDLLLWNLLFRISSDFVTFENNFRDDFLNQSYGGLNLYLIRETRRFCRQVNKKISSCFWTASTCVQRSSLGWCSWLTYMETVDWIHLRTASVTAMMKDLEWPLLEKRRIITRLTMLYKITHGLVEIQYDLKSQSRNHCRYHQFSYHCPNAKTKFYSTSFYPSTLPHWNNLPESVVSLPKLSLFKEAMSKIILVI